MPKTFRGSYTVSVTPFTSDGNGIDIAAQKRFLDWQLECDVPGIIILGTTGEFLSVSDTERTELVKETVNHVAGRMDVLVGAMNAHTPNAVRYAKEAEDLGADGLMIIPPYYYTPTEDEIFGYYQSICDATSLPKLRAAADKSCPLCPRAALTSLQPNLTCRRRNFNEQQSWACALCASPRSAMRRRRAKSLWQWRRRSRWSRQ